MLSTAGGAGQLGTSFLLTTKIDDRGRSICDAISIPVIGHGVTGHGNAANVHLALHIGTGSKPRRWESHERGALAPQDFC